MRRVARAILGILFFGAVLFVPAGRLDWSAGWAFLVTFRVGILTLAFWGPGCAPGLRRERRQAGGDSKSWDKAIIATQTALLFGMLILSALDAARFGWSAPPPPELRVVAWAGLGLTFVIGWWSLASNPFASRQVRIQEERGHRVASTGPYRFVRHPMYVGVILCTFCIPLVLGSWWGLIPAGAIAVLSVIRTAFEDRMLRDELEGYREYAERVRYRMLPAAW